MPSYSLREYRTLPWVRFLLWFRVAFSLFLAVLTAWTAYEVYAQVMGSRFSLDNLTGSILIFLIVGLFAFWMVFMRPPALELAIDETGVRLDYERGTPDTRRWNDALTRFRGRRTDGVSDSISRGKPLCSIYGRLGGLSESFIPAPAFEELVAMANAHGFVLSERSGRPGWTLYSLERK
jgi:hypothetical protein